MALSSVEIARMIDVSCVKAESTEDEIRAAAALAVDRGCIAVFALPAHTPLLGECLSGSPDVTLGGVVGFPAGGSTTTVKAAEARELVAKGCAELDMVVNITWLKAGRFDLVRDDISAVVEAGGVPVKVILECHHLSDEEIASGCRAGIAAGAAWLKTGTGWAPTGATVENVRLIAETVDGRCGVKAAGGVRDIETLLALHEAGAGRFGIGAGTAREILS